VSVPAIDELTAPTQDDRRSLPAARKSRIAFFGIFGIQNLGNECTLQAILYNARKALPDAEIHSISFDPTDTVLRHRLEAVAVSQQNFAGVVQRGGLLGALAKILRLLRRVPAEWMDWIKAIRALRGTDVVFMTGTGMLTDYATTSLGFPYHVFRWTAAARLAKSRVRFVGVGVGPIYEKLSRWFIKTALSLADYRSFRDRNSQNRIKSIGFNSEKDHVFPDLAFSLPRDLFPKRPDRGLAPVQVGLGVMDHRDIHLWTAEQHSAHYAAYLEKMCDFVTWLVDNKYSVRILQGDARHDTETRAELKTKLEGRGIYYSEAGIIDEGSSTVEELIKQIAQVDIVVSPRFHNLVLGLMMNIPAISISYDPKNDCLLDEVGLGVYHQQLTELDVDKLTHQLLELEARRGEFKPLIEKKTKEFRDLLHEQYRLIFSNF
jgi:polysaccharide pyruvyl transferase WcaK-like protein